MNPLRLALICLAAASLFACAKASLRVETDIYKGTPSTLTDARAQDLLITLQQARIDSNELVSLRIALVEAMLDSYWHYQKIATTVNGLPDPSRSSEAYIRRTLLPQYKTDLENTLTRASGFSDEAEKLIECYLLKGHQTSNSARGKCTEGSQLLYPKMLGKISGLRENFRLITENKFGQKIEESLGDFMAGISSQKLTIPQGLKNQDDVVKALNEYQNSFATYADILSRIGAVKARTAATIETQLSQSLCVGCQPNFTPITEAATKGAELISTTSLKSAKTGRSHAVLSGLARGLNLYTSQIDRIQDPSDPAWKTIIAADEESWAPQFSKTYYKAEGKASVIVARDRLGHYRVIRATNNPAQLIAGQLRMSRAIASVAMDAALAASGVPSAPGGTQSKSDGNTDGQTGDAAAVVTRELQLKQELATRANIRANLRRQLEVAKERVHGGAAGKPIDASLRSIFIGIVESHKQVLKEMNKE